VSYVVMLFWVYVESDPQNFHEWEVNVCFVKPVIFWSCCDFKLTNINGNITCKNSRIGGWMPRMEGWIDGLKLGYSGG